MARHPMRLTNDGYEILFQIRDGFAVNLVCGTAVELEISGAGCNIRPGLRQRFAGIAGFDGGQIGGIVAYQLSKTGEQTAAIDRVHSAPVAR